MSDSGEGTTQVAAALGEACRADSFGRPAAPAAELRKTATDPAGWFLCMTKPRQEAFAQQKLDEQGYLTFLPQLHKWVRAAGHWQRRAQPMFPRYIFVRPGSAQQAVAPIRSTPGITNLVRFGPVLATMSGPKLLALMDVCQMMARAQPGQPFEPGMHVVFASGPLRGASGIVAAVAQHRVNVMLSLLGQQHSVKVEAGQLAAA